jgi:hypothetical protein
MTPLREAQSTITTTGAMTHDHAAITGWGKCMPPAVLTNEDLSTFLETNDEWITSRTGIAERRVSHVLPGNWLLSPGPGRWPVPTCPWTIWI